MFSSFIQSLLRVNDVPGTDMLMLALGYALGSIVECIFAYSICVYEMKIPQMRIARLTFESFSSSVIGGFVAYWVLNTVGTLTSTSVTISIFIQGLLAGILGIVVSGTILWMLQNRELRETVQSLRRRFRDVPQATTAVQPTDIG